MPAALTRWLRFSSLTVYRLVTWSLLAAAFAVGAVILGLRYWVLPNVDQHRETIARMIGQGIGQRIAIGRVSGNWDGLHPELVMDGITIFDREGRPALQLGRIEGVLSWLSFAALEPRFRSVEISEPVLSVRRDARGALHVAGIELKQGRGGGLGDWLLRQRRLSIRGAAITWQDELRGAAPLALDAVDFLLRNRGSRHRYALRAVPPRALAGPLDVRGEFTGRSLSEPAEWHGRLFVQVDGVDLDGWRPWLPSSFIAPKGMGALRMWLSFREQRLTELTADVRLAKVEVRLAPELPELKFSALSGRVGWKDVPGGVEISTTRLALASTDGLVVQPTDFFLRLTAMSDSTASRGELRANALALEPLAALADYLPLERELRSDIIALSPRGNLFDVALHWNGPWRHPAQYVVRGRFEALGLAGVGKLPGFAGLTGAFEGSESYGTVRLDSTDVTLDMPSVFRGPLELERLVADVAWSRAGRALDLQFSKVGFSNGHLEGTASGAYRFIPDTRGFIDLTGHLSRADARYVAHYVPVIVGGGTRDWLDQALLSGQSKDVSLRLKGDLAAFPFADGKRGVFEVNAKVTEGVLDYATGWPRIEDISGEVVFRGKRMEVYARQGTILGAKLVKVRAEIPDLVTHDEMLNITGEAEGPSGAFLGFIEKSPVLEMIDRFTEGIHLQGSGKLALKFEMPLRALEKSKVAGSYQFAANRLVVSPDMPPLEQATGRLEFTESTVRVPTATAIFLGGPFTLSTAPPGDATVRLNVQGRTSIENVRQAIPGHGWLRHVSGATDWKGTLTIRKKLADLIVESSLAGIASELPAPLAKSAAQEIPLRLERRFVGQAQGLIDRIDATYGEILSARVVRRHGETQDVINRATIRFGGLAPEPHQNGIRVSGELKRFDADRWLAFARSDSPKVRGDLADIDVKFGELQAMNRLFHEVMLAATTEDSGWRINLSAREFEGTAKWEAQDRGKLTARMKKLVLPAAIAEEKREERSGQDLPALDVVADQFEFKDKMLGKLELGATPVERDWRIDRLRISNADGVLVVDGLVREMASQPRTRATVRLDVTDIGKFLTRLGYPEGVRRGTAHLEGTLAWPGGPHDFELSALAGNLMVDAAKGQFVRLEPGIGKLLGIVSLQALPRRVTLDFRDIFSEGFAFDQIAGELAIERGVMKTDNFRIQGPAARVAMSGEVDLAKESQRLRVRIVPSLSDSVSIAGALIGGPVAGVATILAQKILKDPLDQIFAYEYNVTGTWTEPQVSKIERPSPTATEAN